MTAGIWRALARDRKRARRTLATACGGYSARGWRKRRRLAQRLDADARQTIDAAAA